MEEKDKYAVRLSEKEGISYDEAYAEMMATKRATGLSFADYFRNNLHQYEVPLRFRKAELLHIVTERRRLYIKEISRKLNISPKEVRADIRRIKDKYNPGFEISSIIYHDYELYQMDDEQLESALKHLSLRKDLSSEFKRILNSSESHDEHIDELSSLYDEIKDLTSKLLTCTLVDRAAKEFHVLYPHMADNETAAKEIALDYNALQTAAGYDKLNYVLYDLFSKSLEEKLAFASKRDKADIVSRFSSQDIRFIFDDKYSSYQKFKKHYKRSVIQVKSTSDLLRFWFFCKRHPEFVKKPAFSQQGQGIRKVKIKDFKSVKDALSKLLKEDGEFIAEELIKGHPSTAVFNNDSLNTLRILTFNAGKHISALDASSDAFSRGIIRYAGDGIYCLAPFFKTGRAGSFVDNAGGGGVFSAISLLSGKSSAIACDENGATYTAHPDSGIPFHSLVFGKIDYAVNLVAELALKIPEAGLIGWDLAYTDKEEWALIEANYSPTFIGQGPAQYGIRDIVHTLSEYASKPSP